MELPNNKVKDIIAYFHKILDPVYGEGEVNVFIDLILENILKADRSNLTEVKGGAILESEMDRINKILQRLKKHEPIQYIFGNTFFYGLNLKVNAAVLIPRPETEELVDIIVKSYPDSPLNQNSGTRILDIGTGSGCIAIALKKSIPSANVTGLDISAEALAVAKENAKRNNFDINFKLYDVLGTIPLPESDVIVSNPPYITNKEKQHMHQNVLDHEPHLALFVADDDPLQFYKAITKKALASLSQHGILFFEINENYGNEVQALVNEAGFRKTILLKDINGKNRILKAIL